MSEITKSQLPLIETVLVLGCHGVGKSRLIHHMASQIPQNTLWTVVVGANSPFVSKPIPGCHVLHLAPGCVCCSSRLILNTHLSRTLRLRRPHFLWIEVDPQSHPHEVLQVLQDMQWRTWLAPPKVIGLLNAQDMDLLNKPLGNRSYRDLTTMVGLSDVLIMDGLTDRPPQQASCFLLDLRSIGGANQVRIHAQVNNLSLGAVLSALVLGRRLL